MHTWYLITVWVHILAAAVWIGSMVFLGIAVVPLLRTPDLANVRTTLLQRLGLRFRWIGWGLLLVLIATGVANVGFRGYTWSHLWDGTLWQGTWGRMLAWKVGLVGLMLVVNGVHDFYLGPRATQQIESGDASAETARRAASYLGRLVVLLSLVILALAVMLVRGGY